jgi:hypothetical protein
MDRDLLWNCRILFYVITKMGRNPIGIAKKLGRDLLLNCKILSSSIIAILPAPIIAYRLSQIDLGSSGSPWATSGVGWADLCSIWGPTVQYPICARSGLDWPLLIRLINLLHPIRSDCCAMNTLFYWFFRGSRESASVSDYTFSWKYLIEMLVDKAEIIPI